MYDLIKKYEGCRLTSYLDPLGIPTIGYGNTFIDGKPVKLGMTISKTEADMLLENWVKTEIVPHIKHLNLKPKQQEAITSLIYNIGLSAFLKSKLYMAIKNDDYAEICRQWDFGFKNNLKGLFKRRTEELYLFISEI